MQVNDDLAVASGFVGRGDACRRVSLVLGRREAEWQVARVMFEPTGYSCDDPLAEPPADDADPS